MLESLSTEQLEFIKAIENYKNEKKKLFLSWSEVLDILKDLGYQKVAARRSTSTEASSAPLLAGPRVQHTSESNAALVGCDYQALYYSRVISSVISGKGD